MDAIDRARSYGAVMDESLTSDGIAELRESVDHSITIEWDDPDLAKVLRLRLIGCCREYPFWDISYCYGQLRDGRRVRVNLPVSRLNNRWKAHLVALGKRDGVFVAGLGLLDEETVSRLFG